VLALQDEVARDIAEEIRITLKPEERMRLADARPVDPAAHDAYLRGRYFWNRRTEAELHKAKDYFEQAIAKDPGYAPAYSGLADTYFYLSYGWGHIPPREGMPLARAAALKAIELDDSSAEGHTSLAIVKYVYDWDIPGSEQEFRRAIALNPNYEMGHHGYTVLLSAQRHFDESVAEARKAVEVDPLSVPANNMLGIMLVAANRYDEALAVDKKTLDLDPNPTHLAMVHGRMADCYRAKGLDKEAFEEDLTSRLAQGASPQKIAELRKIYALSGRHGILKKDLQEALTRWEKDHWHNDAYLIATLYADLGEMSSAFAWIDKCMELRSTVLFWIYVGDNPLQHDPRFSEVKRKMGVKN
jgi:tetratricopeptide (TPR) repeat protein